MITTATREQLQIALDTVNRKFADNIRFKDIRPDGRRIRFTLTVNDSKKPGSRIGNNGRRIAAACWHVHGYFFESLWQQKPDCLIIAGPLRMTSAADNWQDSNIGSYARPMMHSEACHCAWR